MLVRILLVFLFTSQFLALQAQFTAKRTLKLMGSRFDITAVGKDSVTAHGYVDTAIREISRIERLISSWDPASQTSEINRNAGIKPVKVDKELFDLISRSIAISQLTDGAFDISYASMDRIWKFDGTMKEMPSAEEIRNSVSKVGFSNIELNPADTTVFLRLSGMKIGFGAIGKGYAADRARNLLVSRGAPSGIINASGDMRTWGKQANGEDWTVAIVNPMNKSKVFALLPVKDGAVVTSGDYERFVEFNGVRYAHIINPKTGYPSTGILSATVFAPSAELADALATSVFVLGIDTGLSLVEQLPGVECIIVDNEGHIHSTKNIQINHQ